MILFRFAAVASDTSGIRYSIDGSLNSTFQSQYNSENSSADNGSFVWDSHLNAYLSLKLSKDLLLSNILKLGYGQINIKTRSSNVWSEPMINSDFINFTTSLSSNDCKKYFGFLRFNFKSSFFDQTSKMALNPFTLNGAAGATFTYRTDNLTLSMAGSAGIIYKKLKRLSDSTYIATGSKGFTIDQRCNGNIGLDIEFNYILSQHLYLYSNCQISQSFNSSRKKIWRPPEASWSLSLNAPVTSYLNFCYSANLEVCHLPRTRFGFNHSLNAGLYFDLKSK